MSGYSTATRNRALRLLSQNPHGCTGASMLAHGFSLELINELVATGLATASTEREERGDKAIEIVRVKITDAGRRALQ